MKRLISFAISLFVLVSASAVEPHAKDLKTIDSIISGLLDDQAILGAQLIVGQGDKILLERNYGVRSATDVTVVDADTRFCIGSCSKPYTSACIMVLVQEKKLKLDQPIDVLLPQFAKPAIKNNAAATRAPTLRELLCHRSGIYSQKLGMNRRQSKWIRDYTLTLAESVNGIAREKLIAEPGEMYAYSGAGYCVIGRLAEVAANKSFEQLIQEKICAPLGLKRTTYFPRKDDVNIATGSIDGKPNPATPHLFKPLNMPLVGGSLYSTARDSARFAQMMIDQARFGKKLIHTQSMFKELVKRHFDSNNYGMGWNLTIQNGKTVGLAHSGSLASSRAIFNINLKTGLYAVALYTITSSGTKAERQKISKAISAVVSGN